MSTLVLANVDSMSQMSGRASEREQVENESLTCGPKWSTARCIYCCCFWQHSFTCNGHNVILNSRTTDTHTHTHILANSIHKNWNGISHFNFVHLKHFVSRAHALVLARAAYSSEQIFILNCTLTSSGRSIEDDDRTVGLDRNSEGTREREKKE